MTEEGARSPRYSVPSRGRVVLQGIALGSAVVSFLSFFALLFSLPDFTWDWSAPVEVSGRGFRFEVAEAWMYLVPVLTVLTVSVVTFIGSMVYLVTHPLPGGDPPDTIYYL